MRRTMSFLMVMNLAFAAQVQAQAQVRTWTDASGKYHFKGQLLASSETSVILEKENKDLVSIDIDQLSPADQELLKKAAADTKLHTWTNRRGLRFRASFVEFVRRDLTIHRVRGKLYVNDKRFDKLPEVYRKIVPQIVKHFEENDINNEHDLRAWVKSLRGAEKKYTCDGLLLEFEGGDLYAIPWFLLSNDDLARIKPDWDAWQKAQGAEARDHYSLSAQSRTHTDDSSSSSDPNSEAKRNRQIAKMRFQLEAYDADLFDLWEVALFGQGLNRTIVVPGNNSNQARSAVLVRYPNCRITGIRKIPKNY